jgi:hypothetical protein
LGNNRWDFYKKTEYLEDSGTEVVYTDPAYDLLDPEERVCLDKKTLKVWGSPWTLAFPGMNPACKAFTVDTEKELAEKWKLIPDDVDILITHGPAYGILDEVKDYANGKIYNTGSKSLKHAVSGLSKLKLHVFGHIHEQGGEVSGLSYTVFHEEHPRYEETKVSTTRVNCSYVNEHYKPVNKPVRIIL